jgi:hypothetical protein
MTLFGKLLVLFNLALAVFLAAFMFNVYANGIDWTDSKATKDMPPGEFAIHAAKLDELKKSVPPTQTNWLTERDKLGTEEARLIADRRWYDQDIRYVLYGPAKGKGISQVAVATKDDPKTGVKSGQILVDDRGLPVMVPIPDPVNKNPLQLLSLAEYNREDEGLLRTIAGIIANHEQQIAESNKLTDLIIGTQTTRGFQARINDEKKKYEELLVEIKQVEPLYINTLVEAQLINKRHAQMVKRIEELKNQKVAGRTPQSP